MLLLPVIVLFSLAIVLGAQQRRKRRRRKQAMIRQLYAWAETNSTLEPELKQWIQRLPDADAALLVEQLTAFCAKLNWELTWLFAPQIERAPMLKQALEESVGAYVRAVLTGLRMEPDVRAYHRYLAFASQPKARKHRPLVEKLYPKIQIELPPAESTAPRKLAFLSRFTTGKGRKSADKPPNRQEQIAAIQRAFELNPGQTMEALKQTLAEEAQGNLAQAKQYGTPTNVPALSGA